ncbi:MFS transporter, partial [Escherichia coli]|uniref:MFS transporter n=1 Tax=Escherichia coli TaxID=562 RepID=UPI0035C01879
TGGTADRNRSHWSTSKTPSYTKSVSWQHHLFAFVIGFTSAGGVVQIGLTLMAERFPYAKGKATGIYYSAGSIATFTIPLITAHLSQRSIADIMWFDTAIAAIGFLLALFIGLRSRKKTRHHSLKENVAPGG